MFIHLAKISFQSKDKKKNWKYDDIVKDSENSPGYMLKVTYSGIKFFIPKLFNFLKNGNPPAENEEFYNGEEFINKFPAM